MLLTNVFNYFTGLLTRKDGQGMVEYVLILALISIVAIVIMGSLGTTIEGVFTDVNTALTTP